MVCVMFAAAVAFVIAYTVRARRLKKEVLSMRITNGVIVSLSTIHDYDSDSAPRCAHMSLTYAYYDENMQRKEAHYKHRYYTDDPHFYEGQEIIIAHSGEKSYVLHRCTPLKNQ
ncbi:MAG: hypothetical protein K2J30_05195 [Clostridia bacterium]|nr:hypothetical protein [Clostridia bacterium]